MKGYLLVLATCILAALIQTIVENFFDIQIQGSSFIGIIIYKVSLVLGGGLIAVMVWIKQ